MHKVGIIQAGVQKTRLLLTSLRPMLTTNQIVHKGRYRVMQEFGQDRLGGLFEAHDTVNNSTVVLREYSSGPGKVLTASQRDTSEAVFVGIAKVLTTIRHGNLVAVEDYFTDVGNQYLVLESVTGFDLKQLLETVQKRPTVVQAVEWALGLLEALEYLHKFSPPIIHGDICPRNIRFSDARTAKLLAVDTQASSITPNLAVGNENENELNYQPLEKYWANLDQITQRSILRDYDDRSERILLCKLDARSDLYSLGACIYHALTGIQPISAIERASALHERKEDPLRNLSEINSLIPPEVSVVFMKALSLRREFRFYSAAVMSNILRTAISDPDESEEANVLDEFRPLEALPVEIRKQKLEAAIASDELEVRLELELSQADKRQRQLEAEQAKLEEEQKRIEERRTTLEAKRQRHLHDKERLEQAAKVEFQRKEDERRVQERRRLEAEIISEREKAEIRLVEIEADLEQRRLEAERMEREVEEERLRAVERLKKIREERELAVNEQHKQAEAVKQELERAEKRLQQIGSMDLASNPDATHPKNETASAIIEPKIKVPPTAEQVTKPVTDEFVANQEHNASSAPELTFHSVSTVSSSSKRLMAIVAMGAILAILGSVFWLTSQTATTEAPPEVVVPVENLVEPDSNVRPSSENEVALPLTSNTNQSDATASNTSTASSPQPQVVLPPESSIVQQQPAVRRNSAADQNPSSAKKRVAGASKSPSGKKITADDLINDNN